MRLLHIGRATTNDIVIADTTVSRQHAQLMIDDIGQVTIIDLNSSNGTFVNGRRVTGPVRLDPTDIVKVGEYLLPWRQHLNAPPAAPQPASPQTNVASAPAPQHQASPSSYNASDSSTSGSAVSKKVVFIAVGGVALVALIVVLVLVLSGRGSNADNLVGKWLEEKAEDNWIEFAEGGKYTEGNKDAVIFDNATWKAMGVDRLIIKKGNIEVSKRYKFDGDDLQIIDSSGTTTYHPADE